MEDLWLWAAVIVVLAAVAWLWSRKRAAGGAPSSRPGTRKGSRRVDELDTVQAWEPHATRILSRGERDAYGVLLRALPDHMMLAQVPLSRFLKVPTRYSYAEWLKRVGQLSADLVVCDRSSEVLAVVEVRSAQESERSQQRLERMRRVLKAAQIQLLVWQEGDLPSPVQARQQLLGEDAAEAPSASASASSPSAASEREAAALLDDLRREDGVEVTEMGDQNDPPPSTWFDDFDATPQPPAPPRR
jgi:hypothetical protein